MQNHLHDLCKPEAKEYKKVSLIGDGTTQRSFINPSLASTNKHDIAFPFRISFGTRKGSENNHIM
jgi:hypothetical protein